MISLEIIKKLTVFLMRGNTFQFFETFILDGKEYSNELYISYTLDRKMYNLVHNKFLEDFCDCPDLFEINENIMCSSLDEAISVAVRQGFSYSIFEDFFSKKKNR